MFWALWGVLVAFLVFCVVIVAVNAVIIRSARSGIIDSTDIPTAQVAIILAEDVRPDGTLSPMLADRLDAGLGLYYIGKVEKLLLSGDDPTTSQNEVQAMLDYVLAKGVPEEDVFTDRAGFGTYDSLIRARDTFKVKDALLVTQVFHLSRAVYTARALGIDATGVPADLQPYPGEWKDFVRDWIAGVQTMVQLHLTHPEPNAPGPALPITGDGRKSRS